MLEDEVESRQTRLVYLLMGLLALAGGTWAVWMHVLHTG
jgi:hypothetical protein